MRRYIFIASALLACAAASAQNLNPTVQVTNDYEGKLMEVDKQNVPMAVPDSLLKFDWNFNYSVFDNPYKGAYEFSPYRIDMKPDPTRRDNGLFYLRAGAGYSLHPEAQVVFTPVMKGRFGVSVYDDFKGYAGKYHGITVLRSAESGNTVSKNGDYNGHDFANRLGTTLRYDAASAVVTLDGGFNVLNTNDGRFGGNRALGGSAALRARSVAGGDLSYDASIGWNGLRNTLNSNNLPKEFEEKYSENDLGFDVSLGFRLADSHSIGLEPSWHHTIFTETMPGSAQARKAFADKVDIVPYYLYSEDGFSVRAGVRFSGVWRDSEFEESYATPVADYKGRKLYPDFRLSYEAIPDMLVLLAKVVGGQKFNTYSSYLASNHHFSYVATRQYFGTGGDTSVNTFDIGVGASGRVKSVFQYAVVAGFARYFNTPLDAVEATYYHSSIESSSIETLFMPVVRMANFDLLYTELDGTLVTDRLDASAHIRFQADPGTSKEKGNPAMSLPAFTGNAGLVYNWSRRIFAGLNAEWSTGRDGKGVYSSYGDSFDCHAPGWVDLGLTAELRATNKFSLWAEGRNLLNQTVMRDFMIAEKGPYFTAGICLKF